MESRETVGVEVDLIGESMDDKHDVVVQHCVQHCVVIILIQLNKSDRTQIQTRMRLRTNLSSGRREDKM
jgi:hypothetical protein